MANHSLAETRSFILRAHNVVFASLQHPFVPHRTRVLVTSVPAVTPKWKIRELLRYEQHWRCCSVTELCQLSSLFAKLMDYWSWTPKSVYSVNSQAERNKGNHGRGINSWVKT